MIILIGLCKFEELKRLTSIYIDKTIKLRIEWDIIKVAWWFSIIRTIK